MTCIVSRPWELAKRYTSKGGGLGTTVTGFARWTSLLSIYCGYLALEYQACYRGCWYLVRHNNHNIQDWQHRPPSLICLFPLSKNSRHCRILLQMFRKMYKVINLILLVFPCREIRIGPRGIFDPGRKEFVQNFLFSCSIVVSLEISKLCKSSDGCLNWVYVDNSS
jgi:hypothetical protein